MPRGKRINVVAAPPESIQEVEQIIDNVAEEPAIPAHWGRGALLNVRTTGGDYIVTLYPEEYDPRSPERAMRFANPALCQDFVSKWYQRQSHDPRAW